MRFLSRRQPELRPARGGGFTYIGVLLAIALMGVGLAAIGELASTAAKRERERELLFAGDQFTRAIAQYRANSPGARQDPRTLEDLLADRRYPTVRRYLRRIYVDPMTGRADWGLVRGSGGGIAGVYSQSNERPLKTGTFPAQYRAFAGAARYSEWRFVDQSDRRLAGTPPPGSSSGAIAGGGPGGAESAGSSPQPAAVPAVIPRMRSRAE